MSSAVSAGSVDSVDRQQFSTETRQLSKYAKFSPHSTVKSVSMYVCSRLSHQCLLPVLAYSCNGPRLCLIYPFMSNGSLEAHLPNPTTLHPPGRLRVACDVASALHYLHTMPEGAVVHRDVKRCVTQGYVYGCAGSLRIKAISLPGLATRDDSAVGRRSFKQH